LIAYRYRFAAAATFMLHCRELPPYAYFAGDYYAFATLDYAAISD